MLARIFALTLALLAVTTPADAAYVYEDINLTFANGFNATGRTTFNTAGPPGMTFFGLSTLRAYPGRA